MQYKLAVRALIITSLISNSLLADPDTARAQAIANASILYASADPKNPNSWSFYFGPSEQVAATSAVENTKRSVMQSYFLANKISSRHTSRNVSWLFDTSMQMYGNETTTPVSEGQGSAVAVPSETSAGDIYGY